jgi:hypothetical protein
MTTQSDGPTLTESPDPRRGVADRVSTRTAAWLAWSLGGLSLALTALSLLLLALNLSHPDVHISEQIVEDTLIAVVCSTVGAVIASRRPENPIGWIFCTIGLVGGVERLNAEYATYTLLVAPGSLPGGEVLAWSMSWLWVPHAGLYVFLGLLFPNGRLPSSRWRWVACLNVLVVLIGAISVAFSPGSSLGLDSIRDPLEVESANSVASLVEALLSTLLLVAAVSLFLRLRRARGAERQQLKWFAYATTVFASGALLTYVIAEAMSVSWVWWFGFVLVIAGIVGIPTAVGIAILKYRLYDIDFIINRTLVYGALTASLALLYFGGVTLLQELLRTLGGQESQLAHSQLAVVASTLAVAGLFGPLRRRVQALIDRRFYRAKYDAAKTLEAFGARARDEVDLEKLTGELLAVIDRTVQPTHASLWLRPPQREHPKEWLP